MADTHHHHHHHDYVAANAKHFSEKSEHYRSELSLQLSKRCARVIETKYPFDGNQTELLDFACGPGLLAIELLAHTKRIVGADAAQGMVDVFNRTGQEQGLAPEKFQCVYVNDLNDEQSKLRGMKFDVIICVQAYHHFEDPVKMTRDLVEHLKANGRLIVLDFLDDENLRKLFAHHAINHVVAHKHGFSFQQMGEIFQSSGLKNVQVENAFEISKTEMKKYQGYEVFGPAMIDDSDFVLKYFVAYGDKSDV